MIANYPRNVRWLEYDRQPSLRHPPGWVWGALLAVGTLNALVGTFFLGYLL